MRGGIAVFVTALVVVATACGAFSAAPAPDDGGVGPTNDAAPDGVASESDSSASVDGGPCASRAAKFDGDSFLQVASPATGFDSPTLTVEAWIFVRSSAPAAEMHIVSHVETSGAGGWALLLSPARQLAFHSYASPRQSLGGSPQSAVPSDQWVHVAVTRNVNIVQLWIGGNSGGPLAESLPMGAATTRNLRIGVNSLGGNEGFEGLIEEVRISNVVRTISAARVPMTADATTVALWRFEEEGDALDATPNGKTAEEEGTVPRVCMPTFAFDGVTP